MENPKQQEYLLLFSAGEVPPISEIESTLNTINGRLTHVMSPRCMVLIAPTGLEGALEELFPGSAPGPMAPRSISAGLTPTEQIGIRALELRRSNDYAQAKSIRPNDGDDWGAPAKGMPMNCTDHTFQQDEQYLRSRSFRDTKPTSSRMTGRIAVGIIVVSGPIPELTFTEEDLIKAVAEAQDGLAWLGSVNPDAGIRWFYDVQHISIDTPQGPEDLGFGEKEDLWRDPAMVKMGYEPGFFGIQQYIEQLRERLDTDWTFCAYFTKYPLGWFAYAGIGGPRFVMHYYNDGWGIDNIDRVFAHETGHIFGAPDEYRESGCNCEGYWGYYQVPNGNCESCSPQGGVNCIMRRNSFELCFFTPRHFGFPEPASEQIKGAMHVHGNQLQIEFPARVNSIWNSNGYSRITGKPFTSNRAHFSIPTPVSKDAGDLALLSSVVLRVRTSSRKAFVHQVDVFDGERQINTFFTYLNTEAWVTERIRLYGTPRIEQGINVALGLRFEGETNEENQIDISAVGFDFGE